MYHKQIVIFEDIYKHHFYPLNIIRPVFDLRVGIFSIYEKIENLYPNAKIRCICRPEMEKFVLESGREIFQDEDFDNAEDWIFINGRASFDNKHRFDIDSFQIVNDELLYFHPGKGGCEGWKKIDFLDGEVLSKVKNLGLVPKKVEHTLYHYPWEMVFNCGKEIERDCYAFSRYLDSNSCLATLIGENLPLVADGVQISAGAILDTSNGPIVIDENANIRPFSYIEGPTYIGKNSVVDGAYIRGETSIGNVCKVGGEIENSIILDYSNKHHEGFLGHSYLGSWINIGAMATNSDLRNDYGKIKVTQAGQVVSTESIKLGAIIGDFSKVGIGVLMNTGLIVGIGVNLFFQGELITREIPSFVKGGKIPYAENSIDKMVETTCLVMKRRDREISAAMRKLILKGFIETQELRNKFLV